MSIEKELAAKIGHVMDTLLGKNFSDPVIEAIKQSTLKPSSPD
jgi:hypothetical protein